MRRLLITVVFAGVLAVSPTVARGTLDIPAGFARLGLRPGLPYGPTRLKLVRAGYVPAHLTNDECRAAGGHECARYPEIQACAGTGAGFCSARFTLRDKVYAVVTAGPAGRLIRIFENEDSK